MIYDNDNNLIAHCPFTYGYGEQYLDTALRLLQEKGLFPKTGTRLSSGASKDYCDFRNFLREHKDEWYIVVKDVQRKKDL